MQRFHVTLELWLTLDDDDPLIRLPHDKLEAEIVRLVRQEGYEPELTNGIAFAVTEAEAEPVTCGDGSCLLCGAPAEGDWCDDHAAKPDPERERARERLRGLSKAEREAMLPEAVRPTPEPCPCDCNSGGFCGGCGHAGCGGR